MAETENDKIAKSVGPAKPDATCIHEDKQGQYGDNAPQADLMRNSPSKDTKHPFGGMSGGK